MEGERKGNRGAHSAGGKSALFIFSSLSLSLSHFVPAFLTQLYPIYHRAPAPLRSLFFLFHTLHHAPSCPPSISLAVVPPPPRSPSPSPRHSLPLSFTGDLGSHSLSLPFLKLLMLFPGPPPNLCARALPHKSQ